MSDRSVVVMEADGAYTVTTGNQQTCFKGCEAAADQIACLHTIVAALRRQVEEARRSKIEVSSKSGNHVLAFCVDSAQDYVGDCLNIIEAQGDCLSRIAQSLGLPDADPEKVAGEVERWRGLLLQFTDGVPCQYDHHDYCQAHTLHERPCPYGEVNKLSPRAAAEAASNERSEK